MPVPGSRMCEHCRKPFIPEPKFPNSKFCSWRCMLADAKNAAYQEGLRDGMRVGSVNQAAAASSAAPFDSTTLTLSNWRTMVHLCHPDKWRGTKFEEAATDVTRWLLQVKPKTRR